MPDVTGEEFTLFISILSKVKSVANNPQNLADLITEQAELDKEFQVNLYISVLHMMALHESMQDTVSITVEPLYSGHAS